MNEISNKNNSYDYSKDIPACIEDYNALCINTNYNISDNYKYVPFVIYPDETTLLGFYCFTITTNNTETNCTISIKINISKDNNNIIRIYLINYEVLSSDDKQIFVSRIYLDKDDNVLVIWLLNNTEYITKNLNESLIMYPDFDNIDDKSSFFNFIYGEDDNTFKLDTDRTLKSTFELPLYEDVEDPNFKKIRYNWLDSTSTEIAIKKTTDSFDIVYRDIVSQMSELNNKLEDCINLSHTNELITTDKVDISNNDEYSEGKIIESFIPLLFKLPESNAISDLKIIGLKDTTNVPINIWAELKITKFSTNIFVDFSYRQDQKYIAHICIDQTGNYLVLWMKRFMMYNFTMYNLNFDAKQTQDSVNNIYPELKLTDLSRLNSKYFNNCILANNNIFTLNLTTMPQLIVKKE